MIFAATVEHAKEILTLLPNDDTALICTEITTIAREEKLLMCLRHEKFAI